jgi:hypothetical protein
MNARAHFGEISNGNEEQVLATGEILILVTEWQITSLNCVHIQYVVECGTCK